MPRVNKITDQNKPIDRNTYNPLVDDYARRLQIPASYTVFQQDGVIYADHGFGTGKDYSGANETTVIQAAIDALTSGGKIFIKDGLYAIKSQLNVLTNNIEIWGESWNTILKRDVSLDGSIIAVGNMITQARVDNVVIANLQLDGNKDAGGITQPVYAKGLVFHSSPKDDWSDPSLFGWNNTAYRIYAHHCGSEGISFDYQIQAKAINCLCEDNDWFDLAMYFSMRSEVRGCTTARGGSGGFNCNGLKDSLIVNCFSYNHATTGPGLSLCQTVAGFPVEDNHVDGFYSYNDSHGIKVGSETSGMATTRNVLEGIIVDSSYFYGIYMIRAIRNLVSDFHFYYSLDRGIGLVGAQYNKILNGFIYNAGRFADNTYDGITLESVDTEHSIYNEIRGVHIISDITNRMRYAINEVDSNQDYQIIENNFVSGSASTPIIRIQGVNTKVRNNVGFVTENSGTATIGNGTETTGNIAHGLAGTPTVVFATGSTADTEDLYCDSKDATNIVIKCVGAVGDDRTIYWKAEYKP